VFTPLTFPSVSNQEVQLGLRNPGDIMGLLQEACGDTICEPKTKSLDTKLYTEDEHTDYNIEANPVGDYKAEDRQRLFDMLNKAAWTVMQCQVVSYRPIFGCPGTPQPGFCPTPEAEEYVICQAPRFWAVQMKDNSGNLQVSLQSEQDNSAVEWCEKMLGQGEEIAGKTSVPTRISIFGYYLLTICRRGQRSCWHRIRCWHYWMQDELGGSALLLSNAFLALPFISILLIVHFNVCLFRPLVAPPSDGQFYIPIPTLF
jgi:hypothetical protein